jgi:hypothetical protein
LVKNKTLLDYKPLALLKALHCDVYHVS